MIKNAITWPQEKTRYGTHDFLGWVKVGESGTNSPYIYSKSDASLDSVR